MYKEYGQMAPNTKERIASSMQRTAKYGAWFGEGHTLNFNAFLEGSVQTNTRAEPTMAIEVHRLMPKTIETQLCVDSQMVLDGAMLWLEGWRRRGWKMKQ